MITVPTTSNLEEAITSSVTDYLTTFETVASSDGNLYQVIGSLPSGLRLSFRMWREGLDVGKTFLGFRLRVGDKLNLTGPAVATNADFNNLTLSGYWTSTVSANPTGHRSILGTIKVPVPSWEPLQVSIHLRKLEYVDRFHATLVSLFPDAQMIDSTSMGLLWEALIVDALKDAKPPKVNSYPEQGEIYWGSASKPVLHILNGVQQGVTPVFKLTPEPLKALAKASQSSKDAMDKVAKVGKLAPTPTAYAAPHPKDALKKAKTAPPAPNAP